jgi:hypothetical protein
MMFSGLCYIYIVYNSPSVTISVIFMIYLYADIATSMYKNHEQLTLYFLSLTV